MKFEQETAGRKQLIHQVDKDSITLDIEKKTPPNLLIRAKGQTKEGGWTDAELSPRPHPSQPPADGIYEFDFIAKPPTGPRVQPVTEIEAKYRWEAYPEKQVKGVRIYAKNNNAEKML